MRYPFFLLYKNNWVKMLQLLTLLKVFNFSVSSSAKWQHYYPSVVVAQGLNEKGEAGMGGVHTRV